MTPATEVIAGLDALDRNGLVQAWAKAFGSDPAKGLSPGFMRKALAHEAQCRQVGGLPAETRRLLRSMATGKPAPKHTAGSMAAGAHLDQETNPNAITLLQLAGRVDLAPGQIKVTLDTTALADLLATSADRFSPAVLSTAAFQHRKRGVETRLVLAGEPGAQDKVLLRNIAKTQQWRQEIKAGRSFDEIAATAGISKRWVQQVIGLAFLAPDLAPDLVRDVVQDVVQGQQPVGFTSRWYLRHDLPSDWDRQRRLIRAL